MKILRWRFGLGWGHRPPEVESVRSRSMPRSRTPTSPPSFRGFVWKYSGLRRGERPDRRLRKRTAHRMRCVRCVRCGSLQAIFESWVASVPRRQAMRCGCVTARVPCVADGGMPVERCQTRAAAAACPTRATRSVVTDYRVNDYGTVAEVEYATRMRRGGASMRHGQDGDGSLKS